MTTPSTISGGGYLLCCCEDGGECDCDCAYDEEGNPIAQCKECCWSAGDVVAYTHTWGSFTEKSTGVELNLFGGQTPVICKVDTYEGGSVSVTYRYLGCFIINSQRARVFALEAKKNGNVVYNGCPGFNRYEWRESCFCYPLHDVLVLYCGTGGDGPFKWEAGNAGLNFFYEFRYCVARVCTSCAAAPETSSIGPACDVENGVLVGPGWSSDPCNAPAAAEQVACPCWCNDCTKDVFDCGGMYGVCLMAKRDTSCRRTGNFYSKFSGNCGLGCEGDQDAGSFGQLTSECEVGSTDVLSILPDNDRNCLWRADPEIGEFGGCCQKKKTMPPNSTTVDVSEPEEPVASYPDVSGTCPPRAAVITSGGLCTGLSTCDCNTSTAAWAACCQPESDDPDTLCAGGCLDVTGRYGISCPPPCK